MLRPSLVLASLFAVALTYSTASQAFTITSEAKVGLTLEDGSSQGMNQASGSQATFLVTHDFQDSDFSAGFFTLGSNADAKQGQLFRMASGLLGRYRLSPLWTFDVGTGIYQSTLLWEADGSKRRASGLVYYGSWQRQIFQYDAFSVALGGFVAYYDGRATLAEAAVSLTSSDLSSHDRGFSRGIELTAFMPLK